MLPLLFVLDDQGTPAIRCLCGAEATTVRRGLAHQLTRQVHVNPAVMKLAPDVSDLGALRMILHARGCERGQALLEAGRNPLAGITGGTA